MKRPFNSIWSLKEQAIFIRKIGELLEQGFTFLEALDFLTYQYVSRKRKEIQLAVVKLKEGHSFHQVLFDLSFHEDLVGFVFFAEQHGQMAVALNEGSQLLLKRSEERERLIKILTYPLFLLITIMLLLVVMNWFVLPKFIVLFQSLNLQQNIFTKFILLLGSSLSQLMYVLLFFLVTFFSTYTFYFRKCSPIKKATILVKTPIFGSLIKLYYTHFITSQLSHLLGGGLSIFETLKAFELNDKTPLYQQVASIIQLNLKSGMDFSDAIKNFPFFSIELCNVIKHGQKNGKLSQELYYFSKYCSEQLAEKVNKRVRVIQPVVFMVIGVFIISMYLAVMLPMYKMLETI